MGQVYRARDTRLGREVAIKVLPPAVAGDRDRLARFEREARAVAALSHPNILALHDFDTAGDVTYAVMELLEGETLRDRLNGGALPVRKSVDTAVRLARGLAAAHAKGLTHRDLKPENVFLLADGQVKILDFGLARETRIETDATATAIAGTDPGVVLGTVGYMAPEQVRGQVVDARADLFALGAVLYEMLSGQRAFKRDSAAETMTAILREDPPELSTTRLDVSPALERIVRHCLEKNPAERFQSARDVAFALEALSGSASSTPTGVPTPAAARRSRRALLVAAAIVGALALAALGGSFFRPSAETRATWVSLTPPHGRFAFYADPAVSPDGRSVAFWARNADNRVVLWVKSLDEPAPRPLPGTESTDRSAEPHTLPAFWSPDGQRLGFFTDLKLKIATFDGAPPLTVAEATNARGGSWCADGRIVFNPSGGGPLFVLPANGGAAVEIPRPDNTFSLELPDCLPNSRAFLGGHPNGSIYVSALDGSTHTKLLPLMSNARYADGRIFFGRGDALWAQPFNPDTYELSGKEERVATGLGFGWGSPAARAFSLSKTGATLVYWGGQSLSSSSVRWYDRTGQPGSAVGASGQNIGIALSPDGKTLAIERQDPVAHTTRIVLVDVATSSERGLTSDQSGPYQGTPVWSRDGQHVLYSTFGDGVYAQPIRGGSAERLSDAPAVWLFDYAVGPPRTLFFGLPDAGGRGLDLWMQRVGSPAETLYATRYNESQTRLSPNGRWVAYTSTESGRPEVYVQAFPDGGSRAAVSTDGAYDPSWRPDGGEIYFTGDDGKLMAARIEASATSIRIREPQPLFTLPPMGGDGARRRYEPSADGQRFLINASTENLTPQVLTVLLNWQAVIGR
jgi:Tol biopolymer transport system component